MNIGALIFSVCTAFFAFVAGGWVCGKIAGILRSEPAMLHGAVVWVLSVPLFVVLGAFTGGSVLAGWYGGLVGTPASAAAASLPFERPEALGMSATEAERAQYHTAITEYQQKLHQWNEDTPRATRNSALGAVTALLLGLVGSVLGGWLACGEPMNFGHHRTRQPITRTPA